VFAAGMLILEMAMGNQMTLTMSSQKGRDKLLSPFLFLFEQNFAENQLLTSSVKAMLELDPSKRPSFRTLTKANNVVSDTLKIVHTKFSPGPAPSVSMRKKAHGARQLYKVNEDVLYGKMVEERATEEEEVEEAEEYEVDEEIDEEEE
jgi:hypothetical protein